MSLSLSEAAKQLSDKLHSNFDPTHFTVGTNLKDTIYIYEHVRGYAKRRRTLAEAGYEGFKVIYKYIGKITARAAK